MFHGAGATVEWVAEETGWSHLADREGFAVAYPQGLPPEPAKAPKFLTNPPRWHDGSTGDAEAFEADQRFIAQMLDHVLANHPIEAERIYLSGFSNGAGMVFAVAARQAARIAAMAPVAGHCWLHDPRPDRPVPTFYLIGDHDPLIPIDGGNVRNPWGRVSHKPAVAETLARWARAVGCSETPVVLNRDARETLASYPCGPSADQFLTVTVHGLGHHWPGGQGRLSRKIGGPPSDAVDGCRRIWEFFRRQRLGG